MVIETITSRQNPLVKILHKLAQNNTAYRKLGCVWLEGEHLLQSLAQRGKHGYLPHARLCIFLHPNYAQVHLRSRWLQALVQRPNARVFYLNEKLWADISQLGTPCVIGALLHTDNMDCTDNGQLHMEGVATVVLDRMQDAGNVGSILRSASAFGFRQIIALKGTAALWSGKVLRAGMGAHFNPDLLLIEQANPDLLERLHVPILATSSHQGQYLHQSELPSPCAWLFGNEGQGLSAEVAQHATQHVRIAQPGGEESLNAAAAAAVCLHASSTG